MSLPNAIADEPDETEAPAEVLDRAERTYGRYRLCFELAAGGMATVYAAVSEGPHGVRKLAALKRIHPHLAKQRSFVDMFLDEARIASMIDHPNVCGVFDFGECDGTYYLAMEYLVGETVSRLARELARTDYEPRFASLAARIVADAAEGLHAAHELRDIDGTPLEVVHRDVSPQNLFVAYDGAVRVVDFGIAQARNRLHQTATGTVKGKYPYMAPEQIRGERATRRNDVWSLGVVLWELLTFERLFKRANEAETVLAVSSDAVPPPSLRRDIDPELDDIVLRALSRDPASRHATARALSEDLERYLARAPITRAEIATTMQRLFPGGAERRRELVRTALTSDAIASGESTTDPAEGSRVHRRARSPLVAWIAVAGVAVALALAFAVGSEFGSRGDPDRLPVREPAIPIEPASMALTAIEPAPPAEAPMTEPAPAREPRSRTAMRATPRVETIPRIEERVPALGPGSVVCSVSPFRGSGVRVRVSGATHDCPGPAFTLPAGRHVLRYDVPSSGEARSRAIDVAPGETTRVTLPL